MPERTQLLQHLDALHRRWRQAGEGTQKAGAVGIQAHMTQGTQTIRQRLACLEKPG
jgi:hypothetical protein